MKNTYYEDLQKQIDLWKNYYNENKILDKVTKHSGESGYELFRNTKGSKTEKDTNNR